MEHSCVDVGSSSLQTYSSPASVAYKDHICQSVRLLDNYNHPISANCRCLIIRRGPLITERGDQSSTFIFSFHILVVFQGVCGCAESSSTAQVEGRRLSDFRVQDLKNECKKRQLPVSGELFDGLIPAIVGVTLLLMNDRRLRNIVRLSQIYLVY